MGFFDQKCGIFGIEGGTKLWDFQDRGGEFRPLSSGHTACWSPAVAEARNSIKSLSIFSCILIWYSFIEQILFYWFQVWQQAAITNKGEHPTNFKLNPKVPAKKVLGRISFSLVKQMFQTLNWSKISNGIRPTVKAFLKMTGNSKLL